MENKIKISKEIKQKIRRYHFQNFKIFLILITISLSSLVLTFIISRIVIFFNTVSETTIFIIIGIMYVFALLFPLSFFFFVKYFTDIIATKDLFYNKYHLENIIDGLEFNQNGDKTCEFQKLCNRFNKDFNYFFWDYFKHYKKRVKTSSIILKDYYIEFEKIFNLVSVNAEIQSNEKIQLLNDFSKFLLDTQDKLLIKILDKKIQINDLKNFIKQKTSYFKDNYKKKYQESSKIIERYEKIQGKKYAYRWLNYNNIISGIVGALIYGIIGILLKYLTEIEF